MADSMRAGGTVKPTKQTVSIHCLAGSSFEMEVNSDETGWNVAERIAAALVSSTSPSCCCLKSSTKRSGTWCESSAQVVSQCFGSA